MPERDSRKDEMTHPSSRTIGDDSSPLRTIVLFGPARASIVLRTIDCPMQCSDWRRRKYNVHAQYVTPSHVLLGLARAGMSQNNRIDVNQLIDVNHPKNRYQYVTPSHVLHGLARAGMGYTIGVRDPELPKRDTSKIGRDSR